MGKRIISFLFIFLGLLSQVSYGAHPLITDDAGTVGSGVLQLEVNGQYGYDREEGEDVRSFEVASVITYGVKDNLDIVLGVPYSGYRVEDRQRVSESGIGDITIELKWRFLESDSGGIALKPSVSLPTGDDEKGLGSGEPTYGLTLIGTLSRTPFVVHMNLSYTYNDNTSGDRKDLLAASVATEFAATEDLTIVGNVGLESNPDPDASTPLVFGLGGLIYSISDSMDIDFGIKAGLSRPEEDVTFLAGITLLFQ